MPTDYDLEKTMAPEPKELREIRRNREMLDQGYGQASRAMSSAEILSQLFTYHPPTEDSIPKYAAINQAAKNFAEIILQNCPPCADRSAAIRLIRDARMTANASVALNGLSL